MERDAAQGGWKLTAHVRTPPHPCRALTRQFAQLGRCTGIVRPKSTSVNHLQSFLRSRSASLFNDPFRVWTWGLVKAMAWCYTWIMRHTRSGVLRKQNCFSTQFSSICSGCCTQPPRSVVDWDWYCLASRTQRTCLIKPHPQITGYPLH